jgi:hypothetical protein
VALGAVLGVVARWVPATSSGDVEPGGRGGGGRAWSRRVALLTAVAFLALLCEGAMNQWTAVYVDGTLGFGDAAGALAFASFALAMAVGRASGDRAVAVLGRGGVVRWGALVAGAGMAGLLVGGGSGVVAACAGAAVVGLGLSCVLPLTLALAGREPVRGDAVATVLLASWPALVVGPPAVAALATVAGIRGALWLVVAGAALVAVLGWSGKALGR